MAIIANLIENIRKARLGKDVRESIAQAIEQTYEDASKNGNVNAEVSEARGKFETLNKRLDGDKNDLQNQVNVERSRINKITKLPAGSTTGDAELQDIRIGASGEEYESAGDAVRGQINKVKEDIDEKGMSIVKNDEYIYVITDIEGKIIWGIKTDGSIEWSKGIPKPIKNRIEDIRIVSAENTEYLYAIVDAENKLLGGIKADGSIEWKKKISCPNLEEIGSFTIENNEYIKLLVDAENKIIFGIKKDGSIDLKSKINWSKENLNDLQVRLKELGVTTKMDWSNASELTISMPRCAIVNIAGISAWPESKFEEKKAWLEFWDCNGNYFKKRIIFKAQGNSSLAFVKKNGAFDICNDEWEGDDTFKLKIDEWVAQDSFHLKAYYTDYFRGVAVVSYQLIDEIVRTRGLFDDRPWKKALIDKEIITAVSNAFGGIKKNSLKLDTGARNFPDRVPLHLLFEW